MNRYQKLSTFIIKFIINKLKKMKRTLFLLVIISLIAPIKLSYGQGKINSGYKNCVVYTYKYKFGELDVDSKIKTNSYGYDDKGNVIEWVWYSSNSLVSSKISFKYDEKGNKIEVISYKSDGSVGHKDSYKYDEKGSLVEVTSYESNGTLSRNSYKNKYDEKGNRIEVISYKSDGSVSQKESYKYDERGKLIEHDELKLDGSWVSKLLIKYDDKGNKIEEKYINADAAIINYKYTFKYDEIGNITEQVIYDIWNDNLIYSILSNKYDDNGNIIESIKNNNLNDPEERKEYIYF